MTVQTLDDLVDEIREDVFACLRAQQPWRAVAVIAGVADRAGAAVVARDYPWRAGPITVTAPMPVIVEEELSPSTPGWALVPMDDGPDTDAISIRARVEDAS